MKKEFFNTSFTYSNVFIIHFETRLLCILYDDPSFHFFAFFVFIPRHERFSRSRKENVQEARRPHSSAIYISHSDEQN